MRSLGQALCPRLEITDIIRATLCNGGCYQVVIWWLSGGSVLFDSVTPGSQVRVYVALSTGNIDFSTNTEDLISLINMKIALLIITAMSNGKFCADFVCKNNEDKYNMLNFLLYITA